MLVFNIIYKRKVHFPEGKLKSREGWGRDFLSVTQTIECLSWSKV